MQKLKAKSFKTFMLFGKLGSQTRLNSEELQKSSFRVDLYFLQGPDGPPGKYGTSGEMVKKLSLFYFYFWLEVLIN